MSDYLKDQEADHNLPKKIKNSKKSINFYPKIKAIKVVSPCSKNIQKNIQNSTQKNTLLPSTMTRNSYKWS